MYMNPIEFSVMPYNAQSIARILHELDSEGKDLSAVKAAMKEIDARHSEKALQQRLQGAAVSAKVCSKARRFIIAWQDNQGRICTLQGIEFAPGDYVFVEGDAYAVSDGEDSMSDLRCTLDNASIKYHIEYID